MKPNLFSTQTFLVALSIILLSACTKETTPLSNAAPFRKDASQAQRLDLTQIHTNTVWKDRVNGVDYIIPNNITLSANLTIEPGVTLQFENGGGIVVSDQGSLTAIGTKGNEILFTSQSGKRGGWQGITFLNKNAHNVLAYCQIEQGGAASSYGAANVIVGSEQNPGRAEINNSLISASNNDGILLSRNSELTYFSSNQVITNTAYGITLYAPQKTQIDGSNTFVNNGKDNVHVVNAGNNNMGESIDNNERGE